MYDVKHDGRHRSWLVSDGHLTDIPVESVYSGVVSLHGIQLLVFIYDINKMETWATDILNAYFEAKALEKVYIITGAEFDDREFHILIFDKSLYYLQYSGLLWHEMFFYCLRDIGLFM